ncbi:type III-A CRISPR-associated RAMP protein Csm5 [Thermomicrobium sp. 4228-Ro]|uniref:type III-A CRISPR-associated RAMP protein Csm5 n=1 Tax=Thermomicrobium sp. 4228-Ro TaxID=2993937 RepID=UPI002248C5CB|nr:type III-A CRISPR-associated RAMP protein Csm5 [Thermomicrobium sp. 4228-Ro]MCX2728511.1 type III-A CRISPR-associated RAMP protein Csm5 [Thermomicrobium sp. 4228-Ro]
MSEPARARPLLALRSYQLELEVLSPLHVGAGGPPLVGGYDVVADAARGRFYLIDVERLIAERMTEERIRRGEDPRVDNLITSDEWPQYTRAVLPGPRGQDVASQTRQHWTLLPFARDARGHPYLPGSSLKGALRTALAYALLREELRSLAQQGQPQRFEGTPIGRALLDQLGAERRPSREWFARPLETRLFQQSEQFDPNHDLLRALRPADSAPLPPDATVVEQVGIYRLTGDGLQLVSRKHRWLVEALPEGTRLQLRLDLDFGVARGLPAQERKVVEIEQLFRACREFAWRLVGVELRRMQETRSQVTGFYRELAERIREAARAATPETYLQLGWGTGWRAKTIGPLLELSDVEDGREVLAQLVTGLRLGRGQQKLPFPRTRRFVERNSQAARPLGWVCLRLLAAPAGADA